VKLAGLALVIAIGPALVLQVIKVIPALAIVATGIQRGDARGHGKP
jgi:hypothetical protein